MTYRVNYGQGQVSGLLSRKEAQRHAQVSGCGAFVQRYEPGDAECPGVWVRLR